MLLLPEHTAWLLLRDVGPSMTSQCESGLVPGRRLDERIVLGRGSPELRVGQFPLR